VEEPGRIGAIVLAAGASERMRYPKPLLIFGKQTAVDRVITISRAGGCDPVVVVLGSEADRVRANASLEAAIVVANDDWQSGRTGSLQAGLRALPADLEAFLLFPVDHAMVDPASVAAILAARRSSGRPIVVPTHEGRRGHPVLFDASLVPEFLALGPSDPARAVTNADPARVLALEIEDAEILRNVDAPADYYAALEVYSARGGEAGFLATKGSAGRAAPKRPPV